MSFLMRSSDIALCVRLFSLIHLNNWTANWFELFTRDRNSITIIWINLCFEVIRLIESRFEFCYSLLICFTFCIYSHFWRESVTYTKIFWLELFVFSHDILFLHKYKSIYLGESKGWIGISYKSFFHCTILNDIVHVDFLTYK